MTFKIPKAPKYARESGRIHASTYLISVWFIFGLVILAVIARFAIQFHQRKKPGLDDLFLVVAFSTLIASIAIIQAQCFDAMYIIYAVTHNIMLPPPEIIEIGYHSHIWITAALMAGWATICAVKFSFLFFFKRLIERIRSLYIYWWIIFVFNLGVFGYGITIYYIGCPWFYQLRSITCTAGEPKKVLIRHSFAQISLDIASDIFILVIPIIVVHRIQVSMTQKLVLGLSLCLTVTCVVLTIIRGVGLTHDGQLDQIWEIYWQVMAQLIGILMAALVAFRSFFVVRSNQRAMNNMAPQTAARRFFKESFLRRINMRRKGQYSLDDSLETGKGNPNALPSIPRGQMTGMNTFINGHSRSYGENTGKVSGLESSLGSKFGSMMGSTISKDEEDAILLNPYPAAKVRDGHM